ncbi:hypothetical protein D3C77_476430 [compost metagenome]
MHLSIPQQQRLALKARIAAAFEVLDIGQVTDAGLELAGFEVDRRFRIEVTKGQGAVINTYFVEGNGQQFFQLLAPVSALTGLRGLLAGAIDEVECGAYEHHFGHHCMVVPQRMPADREVDHGCLQKRHRHLARGLDDVQAVDCVSAAPQGQVDVRNLATVVTHVGELVIEVVAHHYR